MLRCFNWSALSAEDRQTCLARPLAQSTADDVVRDMLVDIRERREVAIRDYSSKLDNWNPDDFRVPAEEMAKAEAALDDADRAAILAAYNAILSFHKQQGYRAYSVAAWTSGKAERRVTPIQTVGLYVPSGTAPLVSTLLMLAAPAQIAGVPRIVVIVPPIKGKGVEPSVLAAARQIGIDEVYAIGGAHGVAALGYGLAGLPKSDKIFGPGNAYVAAAKAMLAQDPAGCATDLPAGPSEVMVVADNSADPALVASDLLSQAEHDTMAQVMLVALSDGFVDDVNTALLDQLSSLPRADIAKVALEQSRAIIANSRSEAVEISNAYAAEHLILQTQNPRELSEQVTEAGSVFLGPWTPEAAGDYAAGPNHALPTSGAARTFGGVTVEMFQKTTTVLELDEASVLRIAPVVERLASLERLDAHRIAMAMRRERAEANL